MRPAPLSELSCRDTAPALLSHGGRLGQSTAAGYYRIFADREQNPARTTRRQTQTLHGCPTHALGAKSQGGRSPPAQGPEHYGHSRYAPALVPCPGRPQMDLRQEKGPRQATYRTGIGKAGFETDERKPELG